MLSVAQENKHTPSFVWVNVQRSPIQPQETNMFFSLYMSKTKYVPMQWEIL